MRLALFTFVLLAGVGTILGHASIDTHNPRVDDRGATISVKI